MAYFIIEESRDGKVFFTSDTHFSAQRTLELSKRPYASVEEMDAGMVKSWNDTVSPNSIVFHLGDFGDASFARLLNGRIILLYGNYERDSNTNLNSFTQYFNAISPADTLKVEINGVLYNLCHEPSHMVTDCFNLFGHCHRLSMVKKHILPDGKIQRGLNVGIDFFYKPFDLELVKFYETGVNEWYDEEVFY